MSSTFPVDPRCPAPPATTPPDLSSRIESLLLAYRTRAWVDGDGNGTPLIYIFSPPSDLTTGLGRSEVSELADYLAEELVTYASRDFALDQCVQHLEMLLTDGSAGWCENSTRTIIEHGRAALASLTPAEPPAKSICVGCDGCGWCEGSPAFKCERCDGAGFLPTEPTP